MSNSNTKKQQGARTANDLSWDLLAEMWLDQEADSITRDLEANDNPELAAEMDAFFTQYDARNLKRIEKETERRRIKRLMTQPLPRFARMASAGIIAAVIVGSIAIASSGTVRKLVSNLLVETTPIYTNFMIAPDENNSAEVTDGQPERNSPSNSLDVPDGWYGQYYPSVIPEGLVLHEIDSDAIGPHDVIYTFPGSAVWQFMYTEISNGGISIDSENAAVSMVNVMGYEATMLTKKDWHRIYWFDGTTLFMITVRGHSEEDALVYANSLICVK